jgi:hypothetical protein
VSSQTSRLFAVPTVRTTNINSVLFDVCIATGNSCSSGVNSDERLRSEEPKINDGFRVVGVSRAFLRMLRKIKIFDIFVRN